MENIREYLSYEPETGKFYWIASPNKKVKAGSEAGFETSGYWSIHIQGKRFLAHRLAFFLMTGELPKRGLLVDHINGQTLDNRWCNLRLASPSENCRNRRKLVGKVLPKGVSRASTRFRANIRVAGKLRHLGYFDTEEEASEAYQAAARELHGEFYRAA